MPFLLIPVINGNPDVIDWRRVADNSIIMDQAIMLGLIQEGVLPPFFPHSGLRVVKRLRGLAGLVQKSGSCCEKAFRI
jgi:hypothetical protein